MAFAPATISFEQGDAISARALTAMLKQIIANNRAGGWRKLKVPWTLPVRALGQ